MLQKRPPKCAFGVFVAVIFFVCYLNQTEASTWRKSNHPAVENGQKDATKTVKPIQEGVIVFGKGHSATANGRNNAAYQADAPGWHRGRVLDVSSKALWKRMSPSLLCGLDQMKFRAVGPGVKLFSLDQDPPLPLSQVPSSCGYNMYRNPFGLVMHVLYDGCNIIQEEGNYVLPLRWHGFPVILKCSKPYQYGTTTAAPQDPTPTGLFPPLKNFWQHWDWNNWDQLYQQPYQINIDVPPEDPVPPGVFPPYMDYWQNYPYLTTTAAPTEAPDAQGFFPPYMHYWQNFQMYPYQTTTTAPTEDPLPQGPYLPWMFYWQYLQDRKETAPTTPPPQPYPWFPGYW